jgi:hypothetical protein
VFAQLDGGALGPVTLDIALDDLSSQASEFLAQGADVY